MILGNRLWNGLDCIPCEGYSVFQRFFNFVRILQPDEGVQKSSDGTEQRNQTHVRVSLHVPDNGNFRGDREKSDSRVAT